MIFKRIAVAVIGVATVMFVAPVAHAFTLETKEWNNSDGSPKFTDPEKKAELFGNDGRGITTQQGNSTFRFDVRPDGGAGAPERRWVNPMQDNGLMRNDR